MRRLSIILLAVLLLTGCGIKFWYNRIDWIVPWFMDDFVELTDGQEDRLEQILIAQTKWHRQQELPRYIAFLTAVRQDVEQQAVAQNYQTRRQQISVFYETLLAQLAPDAASLMAQLTPEQANAMLTTLAKQDKERMEEYSELSAAERVVEIEENLRDSLRDWVGRLTSSQRALVKEWAAAIKDTTEQRMIYRKAWREAMAFELEVAALDNNQQGLEQLITNGQQFQSETLRQLYQHNAAQSERFLIALYESLSARQKQKLINRLNDYIDDFNDLNQQS
ncbi:MAG: hypothetical protein HWE11_15075 [Gammaproteobacteria bacterium]|nr:hypothetical protein [Gammaproteobacteria bacterium]